MDMTECILAAVLSLRRRPAHERRIIAIVLWAASAAAVVALWLGSLEGIVVHTLRPSAREQVANAPAAATLETTIEEGSELSSPFAALGDALGGFIAESKRLLSEFQNGRTEPDLAPVPLAAAGSAPEYARQRQSSPPASPSASPAAAAEGLTSAEHPFADTARVLSASLPESADETPRRSSARSERRGWRDRIGAVIAYNLLELRRAAADAYHYVRQ